MIKVETNPITKKEEVIISGKTPMIAMEFEGMARELRNLFCEALGAKGGVILWEECVNGARKSKEDREREIEEELEHIKQTDPEKAKLADAIAERLLKEIREGR